MAPPFSLQPLILPASPPHCSVCNGSSSSPYHPIPPAARDRARLKATAHHSIHAEPLAHHCAPSKSTQSSTLPAAFPETGTPAAAYCQHSRVDRNLLGFDLIRCSDDGRCESCGDMPFHVAMLLFGQVYVNTVSSIPNIYSEL
jgi:hypothetical protein